MPKSEIKNTFTGGRMNKDLDERLITTGEYRDAMNVQVTTSDSGDVGELHNIMGNSQVSNIINSDDAICIGSVVDEKVNKLYWMVSGLGNWNQGHPTHYKADAIAEYDFTTKNVKPVVVDIHKVEVDLALTSTLPTGTSINLTSYIDKLHVGMVVEGYKTTIQVPVFTANIVAIDISTGTVTIDMNITNFFAPIIKVTRFVFTSERRALNFNRNHLITGINIIEKQLFWTDDNSEPKRIHIERYRDIGTSNSWTAHSFTPTRNFNTSQLTYINIFPLLEEHITVIRQKPLVAPQLLMDNSIAIGITEGEIINETDNDGHPINSIGTYGTNDTAWIDFSGTIPDFQNNNILVLTSTGKDNITQIMRVKVIGVTTGASAANCAGGIAGCTAFNVEILSVDPTITITDTDWHAELEQDPPLFEFKFPRFATRYKYEDGEYSAFSPFSEVAFLPDRPGGDDFDFVAYKGYNIGMTNQIRRLALKDFIPEKDLLPDDVIEIDILYKESNSPNIYSILTIKPSEKAWQTRVTYTGNRTNTSVYPYNFSGVKGYLPIESEMIHGVLPENQLLRPWDNVPRKAKAQEVSGNRLIYGNYLQNYDLLDAGGNIITPSITIGTRHYNVSKQDEDLSPEQVYPTDSYKYSPSKSIKSLRTYQLGITYVDKYGRETPVLTDNNEKKVSTYLNEWYSDKQVKITGQVNNTPPDWAEYQKFFIKETSSEYYNLALDRWYDAEDGNIWLSFPSSERNKVDIDTYLILKKEHDNNNPVLEEARYDILAIENEAPEFIKTREVPIGNCVDDGSNNDTFGPNSGTGFPAKDLKFVEIKDSQFNENIVLTSQETKGDIFIRFKYGNVYTKWYEITNVTDNSSGTPNGTWILDLAVEFGDDINILTTNPLNPYANKRAPITAEFMQKRVENKAEFDGRFFVKIYSDGVLRTKVAKANSSTTAYGIVQAEPVQHISPTGGSAGYSTQSIWHGWGITNGLARYHDPAYAPNSVSKAQSQTGSLITTYGISNTISTNQWSSSLPPNSTITGNVQTGKTFWEGVMDDTSGFFIDDTVGYDFHGVTGPGGYPEINWAHLKWGSGIDSSGWWLHLSYSGWDDGLSTPSTHMLSTQATTHVDQIKFISALTTAGTLWKWGEDPDETIYITTSTTWGQGQSLYNYAKPDFQQAGILWIDDPWEVSHYDEPQQKRNRWAVNAKALVTGQKMGSGPHGYLPTNDATNAVSTPRFDHLGNVLTEYPAGHSLAGQSLMGDPAPGIRIDGMSSGLTALDGSGNSFTIPSEPQRWNDDGTTSGVSTVTSDYDHTRPPGSVTWQILEPISTQSLTYSSHNPAIFETEPKESLDLEIYHEVGQKYPITFNSKTNELYIPVGSIVTSTAVSFISTILVSACNDNTVTLLDDTANTPITAGINVGDELWFTRANGSATSAVVNDTSNSGNGIYGLDPDVWKQKVYLPWFNCYSFGNGVESNRIRDDYNQVTIDKGPKVSSILSEPYKEERRGSGLIYSGIYNSMSGVNNLNQFIQAEKITKDLNPTFGSIQKLFQRHINLIAFCEDRVVKILSNKDVLYNADGNSQITATGRVLGDSQPYVGDYGISKNPESFASESYRAYFTDRQRGAVLRLSKDGLTPISDHGMSDYFKDNLSVGSTTKWIIGSFDAEKREYNLTTNLQYGIQRTISFREDVKGWVSFKSFLPENGISLSGRYYTFNKGNIWRHHAITNSTGNFVNFNTFYGNHTPSRVTTIFNTDPKSIKNFQTLNYEGSQSRVDQLIEYTNPNDQILYTDPDYHNLEDPTIINDFNRGWYVSNIHTDMQDGTLKEFIEKEGKWFNYIRGEETPISADGHISANFAYDPNEFSWQGIGSSNAASINQIGGCTDVNAANYGCATLFHPNWPTPCTGDSPNIYGVCADGFTCSTPSCCGPGNGWDTIDFDDGTCDLVGVVYGCLSNINAANYGCATALYSTPPTSPCPDDGVTHDDGSCVGVQGCTDPNFSTNYNPIATLDCNGDDITLQGYIPQPGWNADPCCIPIVYGCLDASQFNYANFFGTTNSANTACDNQNMGCFPPNCTGPGSTTFGECCTPVIYGCLDINANNYAGTGNTNGVSPPANSPQDFNCVAGQTILTNTLGCNCTYDVTGCTDNTSILANGANGTWPDTNGYGTDAIYDCTTATPNVPTNINTISLCLHPCANGYWVDNYNPCANVSALCTGPGGCMNQSANNYNPNAYYNVSPPDPNACQFGCCDSSFSINQNHELVLELGPGNSCSIYGGSSAPTYRLSITQPDGNPYTDPNTGSIYFLWFGTLLLNTPFVLTIDPSVIAAQGSGVWEMGVLYSFPLPLNTPQCRLGIQQTVIVGCTDDQVGSNPDIHGDCVNNAPCSTLGCCLPGNGYLAEQYDPHATVDDGSCTYPSFGCTDCGPSVGLMNPWAQATPPTNCDPLATVDDGSCLYQGCTTANNASGGIASNYNSYYNLDCNGDPIGTNNLGFDSCCNFGTTACTNIATGCHPDINGHCNNAVWDHATQAYTTAGTTCVGSFCCGIGNGYEKTNYNPACAADPNCSACSTCCIGTSLSGCGMQYLNPPNSTVLTLNYDPCVDTNDPTACIPTVYGCVDPTAINYGSYVSGGSVWGVYTANTNFGTAAPRGNLGNTHNYAANPNTAQIDNTGSYGPNTSSGPAGCGGSGNPCNDCVYPIYGCTDQTALNYDSTANVNQVSQLNTNSPCCYTSGCIMPNYFNVVPAPSQLTANSNLNSTGCISWLVSGGTSGTVWSCYGDLIDVYGITVPGTASGTTAGNGIQTGSNWGTGTGLPVALNGGNTCADCEVFGVAHPFSMFTNQDGWLDPGNVVPNPSGISQLPTNWANIRSGQGNSNDCCIYQDGCADPCADNFNPLATGNNDAALCEYSYGTNYNWCNTTLNPNNIHSTGNQYTQGFPPWHNYAGQDCCTTSCGC